MVDYRPLDPATLLNPYPVYERLRAVGAPVWNAPMNSWVLTSYRDCRDVLTDNDNFAADWRRAGETVSEPALDVHTVDPPDHTAIYTVLAKALRQMITPELAERTRTKIGEMLDGLPSGPVNMITEFTEPLARWFIPEAIGLPQFDLTTIRPVAEAITQAMDSGLRPEARAPGLAAQRQLAAMIESWVATMDPAHPIRALTIDADALGVPRHITMNSLRTLVVNGFTAVPASLGSTVHAISQDETLLKQLDRPEAFERAPHEFFRYEAPIQGTTRAAVRDLEFAGVQVRRGQGMLMLFAAANRDPAQFDEPGHLKLDRWPNPNLTFGYGIHACSGSMLAHTLLREVLTVLATRDSVLRPAGPAVHKPLATVRTLAELPLIVRS